MIKKILNNLKKPHLIPFKILYRLEFFYKKKHIIIIYLKKDKIIFLKN